MNTHTLTTVLAITLAVLGTSSLGFGGLLVNKDRTIGGFFGGMKNTGFVLLGLGGASVLYALRLTL